MSSQLPAMVKRRVTGSASTSSKHASTPNLLSSTTSGLRVSDSQGLASTFMSRTTSAGGFQGIRNIKLKGLERRATIQSHPVEDEVGEARALFCNICGEDTVESGKGLRVCTNCSALQMKSGMMSHCYAVANKRMLDAQMLANKRLLHAQMLRQGIPLPSKSNALEDFSDFSEPQGFSPEAEYEEKKRAWKRMQIAARTDPELEAQRGRTIYSDSKDTGYVVGDRIKTKIRLAGQDPGWDPTTVGTDEGIVLGPGQEAGTLLVKMECSGTVASFKLRHVEKIGEPEPISNIDRNRRIHRASSNTLVRRSTL